MAKAPSSRWVILGSTTNTRITAKNCRFKITMRPEKNLYSGLSNSGRARPALPRTHRNATIQQVYVLVKEYMKTYSMADAVRYPTMTTAQIRGAFLIDALYKPGTL